jgi:hypothetical protein
MLKKSLLIISLAVAAIPTIGGLTVVGLLLPTAAFGW